MRRYRSPAEHRRRQHAAIRGEVDMWTNLRALYGQPADPVAAAADDKTRWAADDKADDADGWEDRRRRIQTAFADR